jgi:hypothetical protein
VVDLVGFDVNQSSFAPEYASALSPSSHTAVAALAGSGRYLVIDPQLSDSRALLRIGAPDLGVIADLPGAGGYGSLTWGPYAAVTGTHIQDGADPPAVADGMFSTLGVRAIFTVPSQLVRDGDRPTGNSEVGTDRPLVRWFGAPVAVGSIIVSVDGVLSTRAQSELAASLELLGDGARPVSARASVAKVTFSAPGSLHDEMTFTYATPATAIGLEIGGIALTTSVRIADPIVLPNQGSPFLTDGPLAGALGAGGWTEVAGVAGFSVLVARVAAPSYAVTAAGATLRVLSDDPWTGAASVHVSSPVPATLVRSVTNLPGWQATVDHAGQVTRVHVGAHGLIQGVPVPAGTSVVTFSYVAPGWRAGQMLALGGALAFACLALASPVRRLRRRRISAAGARSRYPG